MFARINNLVQKVKGVQGAVSELGTQSKELLNQTKEAYRDITQDGLKMDDLAKISGHAQELAKKAGEVVTNTKENIKKVAGTTDTSTENSTATDEQATPPAATPKSSTKTTTKSSTAKTKAAPKKTATVAKKTTKAKTAA